jgi:hypothetical protein
MMPVASSAGHLLLPAVKDNAPWHRYNLAHLSLTADLT